jgi:DNA transposition AAA+ family ATPase
MPYYEVRGTVNGIYNQILDFLQRDMNTVIVIDEVDYALKNERILAVVRDLADQSLVTFVLVGMEKAKDKMLKMDAHYHDRVISYEV